MHHVGDGEHALSGGQAGRKPDEVADFEASEDDSDAGKQGDAACRGEGQEHADRVTVTDSTSQQITANPHACARMTSHKGDETTRWRKDSHFNG